MVVGGLLAIPIIFIIVAAGLFFFLSVSLFSSKDYDGLQLSTPLSVSNIKFVLGQEEIGTTVMNADKAQLYVREESDGYVTVHTELIPGVQLSLDRSVNIYSPIDGRVSVDLANNVFITNDVTQVYIHGFTQLTAPDGYEVKKGDIVGIANQVLETALATNVTNPRYPKWEWTNYYIQYLYWTGRNNLFPLLAPPNDKGVKPYRYSSPFGWRVHPVTGDSKLHNGLDIAVPSNTTVLAVEDGTIESAKSARDGNGGGNRMYLVSLDGKRKYCYMHLNSFIAKAGQAVRKGQRIALSGNTGVSTGPHLHISFYDVVHQNEVYDPEPAVRYWESNMDWDSIKKSIEGDVFATP